MLNELLVIHPDAYEALLQGSVSMSVATGRIDTQKDWSGKKQNGVLQEHSIQFSQLKFSNPLTCRHYPALAKRAGWNCAKAYSSRGGASPRTTTSLSGILANQNLLDEFGATVSLPEPV